jgi:aryl-alcohol dehydrogenase-like predicted oxidoreductase
MNADFLHTILGQTGIKVHRLGLSASYRPGKKTVYKALDEGLNFFFCYGFDSQMIQVLREVMKGRREKYVIATGAYNLLYGHPNLRRTLEKRLRQLNTDYLDLFLFLGVTQPKHFPEKDREEFYRFREEGKVRGIGLSCHHRKFLGELAANGAIDVMMMRYNAAHRGAEQDIFPQLPLHQPGVISYTATRWTYLLRRPRGWPQDGRIPTAGLCYRFVLSNPNVDVCLMAPGNLTQFEENLEEVRRGRLCEVDMEFMRQFGDAVHAQGKWFM